MKYIRPHDQVDCGIACLRMVAHHYGKDYSVHYLRKISHLTKLGASLGNLGNAAEQIGFKCLIGQLSLNYLVEKATLPCILFWDSNHFIVLFKVSKKIRKGKSETTFHVMDPGKGKVKLSEDTFKKYWLGENTKGVALFLETTQQFYEFEEHKSRESSTQKSALKFLATYFRKYKRNYLQVAFAMTFSSFVLLIIPFLTSSIVDIAIKYKEVNVLYILILGQVMLFASSSFADIIRSQLTLHISGRINISILADFLHKLLRLPLSFFDSKLAGDIVQRITDHSRIDNFITNTLLNTFFSLVSLFVFSFILFIYNPLIFVVFAVGSIISVAYVLLFMKARRSLDYERFRDLGDSSDKLYEIVNGIHEIKLNAFENYKELDWQEIQVKLFRINLTSIKLDQYQKIGSSLITQLKNAGITFLAGYAVIQGNMTLGMMLATTYIVGQLNLPINQLTELVNSYQSTKIALERMNDVYNEANEENKIIDHASLFPTRSEFRGLELKNVSFQYEGKLSEMVVNDVNIKIPEGKVTAIVGTSGSGKTTLIKLLLRFFDPISGSILYNGRNMSEISPEWWRSKCGTVMQEGFIFSDTISRNIVMSEESIDMEKLFNAVEVACIDDLIAELPLNFETKIGGAGIGLSTGQKQRILIARAIYKNPDYLFFDEATSSLDAKNEKNIMENLNEFYEGKTVVIVAHRLSTVKNADNIIVIEKGQLVESGTHHELVQKNGAYYSLVKNQLELGVG